MFNLNEVPDHPITLDEIYSKVSELDLWNYYCTNFKKINESFKSDLYNDKNPSCRIKQTKLGNLYYTDYGEGHYFGNVIYYIQYKYNCNFNECLNIIANDFQIRKLKAIILKKERLIEESLLFRPKINIIPKEQIFNFTDFRYWNSYKIPLMILLDFEINSLEQFILISEKGEFIYQSNSLNPIYCYKEYDIELNFLGYRIYQPLRKKGLKWLNNTSNRVIQGIKQLPEKGDLLIITKSLKDCISLKLLGYFAVSLASETASLDNEVYIKLKERFKEIVVLYDRDNTGEKYAKIIQDKFNIRSIFIPLEYNCKDISELNVKNSLEINKKIMEKLINDR